MSIKVMSAVWDIEGIDSSECLVLIALADHADDLGRCYPSIARLAKRTKLSGRGIQKVISRLIEKGFVTVTPCAGQGGANLYTVTATPEPRSPLNDVHPRTGFTTPLNHVRKTPEPRSPKPSGTVIEPSTTAREAQPAVVVAARDSRREEVLSLMGCSAAGITLEGRFTGTTNDQVEIAKWDGLGLSRSEQDGVIRDMLAKQRSKSPGFMPNRWSWFTAGMNELARAKTARPAAGTPSAPAETPEQRRARRRKMIGG
ncbi:helix-turn-helix domain-containing protein [Paracoccus sp. NFXS7]|uniref:helix-turn-helix domain-containing protein n=1 Tax=Paracoccus sp. NFXS7 TaxID=2908653 RepID=UPI0032DEF7AE